MRQENEGMRKVIALVAAVATVLLGPRGASAQAAPGVQFTDVTAAAKITFKHTSGAAGKKYLPETMGSGVVVLDFDGDGWPDLFFANSKNWPGAAGPEPVSALYRNNHDGTFIDVTKAAGLAVPMYALGGVAADYDNDGLVDLYVTCLGANHLFKNLGQGRFADVTAKAGVGDVGFSTSAAFFDYDKDGKLDLYVANYVTWSLEKDLFCTLDGKRKSYCTPESYKGQSGTLYHNRGDGTFEDVTEKAGVKTPSAKALGIAVVDYDGDGWPDLFVANDTQPNRLFRNGGNGTFKDVAVAAGLAFGETGVARAGMGVDAADWSGNGRPGLVVGNFSNEMIGLYQNEGNGLFVDEAPGSGVGPASQQSLTFAAFFFDFDLDGRLDIFAATGHVADDIGAVQPKVTYAQKPHLFRSLGNGRFEDVAPRSGTALQKALVARGAAYLDYDLDGDLDLVVTTNNGPAYLLRNDGGNRNNALRVRTVGSRSNRDGIGAKVTVTPAGAAKRSATVKTGSSYCSLSELPVTFGLGSAAKADVEVLWPSGRVDRLAGVAANTMVTVQEEKGAIATVPLSRK
jgi:enediyne biosynthesis protein E4